jgi:hypothetical protein
MEAEGTQFTPPDDAEEPAAPELLEGSLDPATALLAAVRSVAETASCAGPLPVFDGKRRYDVSFANLPRQVLQKTGSSGFSGEASVCRLKVKPLHGFKPGKRNALDGTMIWFGMAVAQAPPVPVRIETEISLGAVSIELGSARWANQQASR